MCWRPGLGLRWELRGLLRPPIAGFEGVGKEIRDGTIRERTEGRGNGGMRVQWTSDQVQLRGKSAPLIITVPISGKALTR